MKHAQCGITILEILCSLAIMAIIFTTITYYYTQNQRYMAVSKAAAQIQQLANVSYEWQAAQAQADFAGLSMTALQSSGLLNKIDNYTQIDPWGGNMTVAPDPADPRYMRITLSKIPTNACANLRDRMTQTAHNQSSAADCNSGSYYISL
jgi:type II secretory pathway pseudopilin PulG